MFRVRADYREDLEIRASLKRVREFFAEVQNFARLMPGVESITEEEGYLNWAVNVDVSLIGAMRGTFALIQRDDSSHRLEWGPAPFETKNLLRYAISFEEVEANRTLVRVAERVELRRARATELHLMAALAGEKRISEGVSEQVGLMMRTYLKRARIMLES